MTAVQEARKAITSEPTRSGLFGRRTSPQPDRIVGLDLAYFPPEQLRLPVTVFGNVTTTDARRLADALARVAQDLARPHLSFGGAELLENEQGTVVAVRATGDVDALAAISREMTHCVERLGFQVDRRRLRPRMELARSTATTTAADLQAATGALEALTGRPWVVDCVLLLSTLVGAAGPEYREMARFPLGSSPSGPVTYDPHDEHGRSSDAETDRVERIRRS